MKIGIVAILLLFTAAASSIAQVAQVKEALAGGQKATIAEKPEEVRARFEQWLKEAREDLERLDAEGASNA